MKTLRRQLLEAIRAGIPTVVNEDGYTLTVDQIHAEPNKAPQSESDFLSLRMTVFNQRLSGTPDRFDPEMLIWTVRNVVRIQCVGVRAWTWLQVFLDRLQEEETIYDVFETSGITVIHDGTGITDISAALASREQYRGEAVIEVHCRTVVDRVIQEAVLFSVDLTLSDAASLEIQSTIAVDLT